MNFSESNAPPGRKSSTTVQRVTERFYDEITSGRWAVGDRIPTEPELVRWTEAGRNTVREAVQSLVAAGMLRRDQGRGTFVIARSDVTRTVARRASRVARRDGLEVRALIDAAASELAARRRTEDDCARLRRLLHERSEAWASGGAQRRIAADIALHSAIVDATHNEFLAEIYDGLVPLFAEVLRDDVARETDPHADEHTMLVDRIIAADAHGARSQVARLLEPLIAEAG